MKRYKKYSQGLAPLLIFTSLFLLIIGCEKNGINATIEDSHQPDQKITILKSNSPLSFKKLFEETKLIGISGGEIWVGDEQSGKSGLGFPEGALSESENISFNWQSNDLLQADCSPEGTQFAESVYIRLSYKDADLNGANEEDLAICYYNEETESWEVIARNVNQSEKYVDGYIHHFSRYAIGDAP